MESPAESESTEKSGKRKAPLLEVHVSNNNNNSNNNNGLLQSIQQSEVLHLQYLHYKSKKNQ